MSQLWRNLAVPKIGTTEPKVGTTEPKIGTTEPKIKPHVMKEHKISWAPLVQNISTMVRKKAAQPEKLVQLCRN